VLEEAIGWLGSTTTVSVFSEFILEFLSFYLVSISNLFLDLTYLPYC